MKYIPCILITPLILAILLAACGTQSTPVPVPSPVTNPSAETRKLVQGWMDACLALDADKYMSYYSENIIYLNVAIKDFGTLSYKDLDRSTHDDFRQEGFKMEFISFFVSSNGEFAAIQGVWFSLNRSGQQVSIPVATVLEFNDGKIIRQTDYLDGGSKK